MGRTILVGAKSSSYADRATGEVRNFNVVRVLVPTTEQGAGGFQAMEHRCPADVAKQAIAACAAGPVVVEPELVIQQFGKSQSVAWSGFKVMEAQAFPAKAK